MIMGRLGCGVVFGGCLSVLAGAQPTVPLADQPARALLPSGMSHLPLRFNAKLAYVFEEPDGVNALHLVGEFVLTVGDDPAQCLSSREAVVWITPRRQDAQIYHHVELLLWGEGEVREVGGTVTTAPALFVTLDASGEISVDTDDVALHTPSHSRVVERARTVRGSLTTMDPERYREDAHLQVFDVSGLAAPTTPEPKPEYQFRSEGTVAWSELDGGQEVVLVTGGIYASRRIPQEQAFLEMQAGSAVFFLSPAANAPVGDTREPVGLGAKRPRPRRTRQTEDGSLSEPSTSSEQRISADFGSLDVDAAYLEGDVVVRQGPNMIRASRVYYDFLADRAVILDAVVRATVAQRNIPLYARASEIRQLSRDRFAASNARLSTSEFHTPHYHVGASHIELTNRSVPDPSGNRPTINAGSFRIRDATLNVAGRPLMYWPYVAGNLDTSETGIRNLRSGYSDDFGFEIETEWHFFNVLGFETPEGFDTSLSLDYFSRRGPAVGVDAEYRRDRYFGLLRSYFMSDTEEDFLGRRRESVSVEDVRGRLLLRHRQYLERDWSLSLELSYISDRTFLEEFFEPEFDNEKEQETLLYLKRQWDNRALTIHVQPRILDFETTTERLPDVGFHLAGEPLGGFGTLYSEHRLGLVRFRPADQTFLQFLRNGREAKSGTVVRGDTRQEVGTPLDLGPIRFVPFVSLRATAWDDTPDSGGLLRAFGTWGLRGSMYLSRVFPDVRSALFDIEGIRHIVKSDVVAWISQSNHDSDELFHFDETVEQIDEVDGVAFGVRQRWQTKRGRGPTRRTVDLLTLDTELGVFNDAEPDERTNGFISFSRPENSISQNYLNSSLIWRMNDRTALLSELNYDINDGEVDVLNVSLAVERSPRLSYLMGYRFIEESDSELLAFDVNYRLTEKHTLALRELYDFAERRTEDLTVALIRKFPRWFVAVSFALDQPEDDFGVSLSIWPEGLPQAALGSRRFTTLGNTTRVRSRPGG
ncbi:MAG: LPS assembly protein LptD [Phycisphaerae bacterium]|jgi:hypothetical protein